MSHTVSSYFDDLEIHISRYLSSAKQDIRVCVAWISSSNIVSKLNDASNNGVNVEIICNYDFINNNLKFKLNPEIKFHAINGIYRSTYMHNKFCVVDYKTVITGSYNWSKRARHHFENIVVIENDAEATFSYLKEFEDLKNYFSYTDKYKECKICNKKSVFRVAIENYHPEEREHRTYILDYCPRDGFKLVFIEKEEIFDEEFSDIYSSYPHDVSGVRERLSDYINNNGAYICNKRLIDKYSINILAVISERMNQFHEIEKNIEITWIDIFHRKISKDFLNCEEIEEFIENIDSY